MHTRLGVARFAGRLRAWDVIAEGLECVLLLPIPAVVVIWVTGIAYEISRAGRC